MAEEAWVEDAKKQLAEQQSSKKFRLPTTDEFDLCKQLIQMTEPDALTIETFPQTVIYMANAYLTMCGRYYGIKQLAHEVDIPEIASMDFQWCCAKVSISPIIEKVLGPNELSSLLRVVSQLLADRFLGYATAETDEKMYISHVKSMMDGMRNGHYFEALPFVVKSADRYEDLPSGMIGTIVPFVNVRKNDYGRIPCVFDGFRHGHQFDDKTDIRTAVHPPKATGYFVSREYLVQETRTPIFVTTY